MERRDNPSLALCISVSSVPLWFKPLQARAEAGIGGGNAEDRGDDDREDRHTLAHAAIAEAETGGQKVNGERHDGAEGVDTAVGHRVRREVREIADGERDTGHR